MSVASPPRGSRAIDRAAALLVAVVEADAPPALGELAEREALPRSTTPRLAAALERRGLVQRGGRRPPAAGPRAGRLRLARGVRRRPRRARGARAAAAGGDLRRDRRTSSCRGSTARPAWRRSTAASCSGGANWVGRRVPHHASAAGKPFLAWGVVPVPDGRLARLAPRTITSRAALARELERVRERGWAAAVDELEAGLAAVGAPVHAAGGAVVAALTLSGPTVRIGDDRLDELGALVAREASDLSARLGAPGCGRRCGDDRGRDPQGPLRRDAGGQRPAGARADERRRSSRAWARRRCCSRR